jgi:predicted amidohydrolase
MLHLYALQFRPQFGAVERNLSSVLEYLKEVKEDSLVLLPEMWQCGFDYENMKKHAQATGEVLEEIKRVSVQKSLTVAGTYPVQESGRLYNMAILAHKGKELGRRAKIKLFPLYEEQKHFSPGKEKAVFESPFGRLGFLVCFELRFPELSFELRRAKVHIVLVPAMWGRKRKEHFTTLCRARAIELQSFLLCANVWGKVGEEEYAGSSAIYGPWGELLAFCEEGDSLLHARVELKEVEKVRRHIPMP